jgi:hypothetical protein
VSEDDEFANIIAKADHPHAAAERIYQLFGKRYRVEKIDDDQEPVEEDEPETPEEQKERRRRLIAEAERLQAERSATATAAGSPPNPHRTRKALTMDDLTEVADTICKSADPKTVAKPAEAEVNRGTSVFTSYERSAMLTAVVKVHDGGGECSDRVFSKFLQDPGNLLFRQWALLQPDVEALAKRNTRLDDVVAKTRAAGDGAGGAAAIGGREALAVGRGSQGARRTEADKLREQVIRDQRIARPWLTSAELEAYADRMVAAVRSRPKEGTRERI